MAHALRKKLGKTRKPKTPGRDKPAQVLEVIIDELEKSVRGGTGALIKSLDNFVAEFTRSKKLLALLRFARGNPSVIKLHGRYGRGKPLLQWLQVTDSTIIKGIFIEAFGSKWRKVLGRTRKVLKIRRLRKPSLSSIELLQSEIHHYLKLLGDTGPRAQKKLLKRLLAGTGISPDDFGAVDLRSIRKVLSKADIDVMQSRLNKFQGNIGEFIVLRKRLKHLKEYQELLGKEFDEFLFAPTLRADFKNLNGKRKQLNQLTTDGAVLARKKGKKHLEFIDYDETKTTQVGAPDGLDQIHRRAESLDSDGITHINLEEEIFIATQKGIKRVELETPTSLKYDRQPSKSTEGTIAGFHSAKDKRVFAPSDRKNISADDLAEFSTTNPVRRELIESIGLDYDEIRSLAAFLLSGLLGSK